LQTALRAIQTEALDQRVHDLRTPPAAARPQSVTTGRCGRTGSMSEVGLECLTLPGRASTEADTATPYSAILIDSAILIAGNRSGGLRA
jgi:hypothetical protein